MLTVNERFQTEYLDFSQKISKIEGGSFRIQCETLLKKLVAEVRNLELYHQDITYTNNKFSKDYLLTCRSNISSLRQQLKKKLNFQI